MNTSAFVFGMIFLGSCLLGIVYVKFPPKSSVEVLRKKRKEMQNRNKRRQEWEWRRAV